MPNAFEETSAADVTTHGGSMDRPAAVRAASTARPAAPVSNGCREPTRKATCTSERVGSTTAMASASAPSTTHSVAVAPTPSASRRSAGSAASRTSGWT
jgi:hypothetical protein